jgi:3-oxoacyl-[acyl-carrier protein] reductase
VNLSDKVAVVTGGGSGLGEAICLRLGADGAKVAVVDVNEEAAKLTADLCGGVAFRADVSNGTDVERALAEAEAALGPVDIWVNNAGIAATAQATRVIPRAEQQLVEAAAGSVSTPLDALVRLPDDEWRAMLAVHLDGTFFGTRAAARSMAKRGAGVIVNVASVCGIEGCAGYPHYSAAKGGILAFTRSVAKELIVQGIRVNAIAPGFIETPTAGMQGSAVRDALRQRTPLGRFGTSEEIAGTVAFLASNDAGFFVGETLSPNGGLVTI